MCFLFGGRKGGSELVIWAKKTTLGAGRVRIVGDERTVNTFSRGKGFHSVFERRRIRREVPHDRCDEKVLPTVLFFEKGKSEGMYGGKERPDTSWDLQRKGRGASGRFTLTRWRGQLC